MMLWKMSPPGIPGGRSSGKRGRRGINAGGTWGKNEELRAGAGLGAGPQLSWDWLVLLTRSGQETCTFSPAEGLRVP